MGAVTLDASGVIESAPNAGIKRVIIRTPATADDSDTIAFDLTTIGISKLLWVRGWVHTTVNSVVVAEAPTTSVSGTTLTITSGAVGGTDKVRVFEVVGLN